MSINDLDSPRFIIYLNTFPVTGDAIEKAPPFSEYTCKSTIRRSRISAEIKKAPSARKFRNETFDHEEGIAGNIYTVPL